MNLNALLKAEIAKKKSEFSTDKKFIRRSELTESTSGASRDENGKRPREEDAKEPAIEIAKEERGTSVKEELNDPSSAALHANPPPTKKSAVILSEAELRRRFRQRGEPVRLFGESDEQRMVRLKSVEDRVLYLAEGEAGQVQDALRKQLTQIDKLLNEERMRKEHAPAEDGGSASDAPVTAESSSSTNVLDKKDQIIAKYEPDLHEISLQLVQQDSKRCSTLMYVFWKKLLLEWERDLLSKNEDERHEEQWKLDMAIMRQSADNLKPFFKQLKQNSLEPDVCARMAEICHAVHRREYIQANDAYLRLSIGNAPWPIGVTMVGIHERKAHERIATSVVAHVLNDEVQRKWIQAIKRLVTQCQKRKPNPDPSKNVG